MSREKKLIFNSLILMLGTFLPRMVSFFTTPIITANTTSDGYGYYQLTTTTVISLIVPIISLQIEQSLYRFLIDAKDEQQKKTVITTGLTFIFAIMALVGVIGIIIPISIYPGIWKFVLIFYLFSEILAGQSRFILRGFSKYKGYSTQAALIVFVNFIFIFVNLVVFHLGYAGIILSLALANLVGIVYVVIVGQVYKYYRPKLFDSNLFRDMMHYSLPFLPNNIAWYLNTTSDRWMLNLFFGAAATGIYGAANQIPSLVNLIYPAFNMAWMESAIKSADDSDRESYYRKMYRILFRLLAAGSVMLMIISPVLYQLLIRNIKLYEGFKYTSLLIGAVFIYSLAQFLGSIYIALKQTNNMTISTTVAAVVNIAINLAFMPFFGLEIAVYSTFIANSALLLYRMYDINKRFMKLTINKRQVIFTAVVMTLVGYAVISSNIYFVMAGIVVGLFFVYVMAIDLILDMAKKVIRKVK